MKITFKNITTSVDVNSARDLTHLAHIKGNKDTIIEDVSVKIELSTYNNNFVSSYEKTLINWITEWLEYDKILHSNSQIVRLTIVKTRNNNNNITVKIKEKK